MPQAMYTLGLTVCPDEPTWRDFCSHLASTTGREQLTAAPSASASSCSDGDIVLFLDAAADGNQNPVLGDVDITGFGDDRLQIAASRGQNADLGGFVDDDAVARSAFQRLECARAHGEDRAR